MDSDVINRSDEKTYSKILQIVLKKNKNQERTIMEINIITSTAEVIVTSIAGPAGVIIYFLCKFFFRKNLKT